MRFLKFPGVWQLGSFRLLDQKRNGLQMPVWGSMSGVWQRVIGQVGPCAVKLGTLFRAAAETALTGMVFTPITVPKVVGLSIYAVTLTASTVAGAMALP